MYKTYQGRVKSKLSKTIWNEWNPNSILNNIGFGSNETKAPYSNSDIWKSMGGGASIFQKCLNYYKLLSDPILKKKN